MANPWNLFNVTATEAEPGDLQSLNICSLPKEEAQLEGQTDQPSGIGISDYWCYHWIFPKICPCSDISKPFIYVHLPIALSIHLVHRF